QDFGRRTMGPNEKILRDAYARFADGDMPYLYSVLADDVIWTSTGDRNVMPLAGEGRGHAGVRDYFKTSRGHWDVPEHKAIEYFANGDTRFAVRVSVEAINLRTKARVRFNKVDLVTMANGKLTTYEELFDTEPLIKASGAGRP